MAVKVGETMIVGAHMSVGKGVEQALKDALSIGANTMQIFTRNPRGGNAKELTEETCESFRCKVREGAFGPWVAHAPYTINLASKKDEVREFGKRVLKEDMMRMYRLGGTRMVVHSGSHTGQGDEIGLKLLCEGLQEVMEECPTDFSLLLEGMSGNGSELGRTLEQMAFVLEQVSHPQLGVCLDTAHLWGAGYDVVAWADLWNRIVLILGENKVQALHVNDSLVERNSRKDRHAAIGQGTIGAENLREIARFMEQYHIPLILETPNELDGWKKEIAYLKA